MKKADLILTSDWHLRDTVPVSRTDDFWEAQWKKVDAVSELQKEHNCYVAHGGDLFHHWKPSPYLIREAIKRLPNKFYTVYGQHDLPKHNFELRHKSGISVLEQAGKLTVFDEGNWGQVPVNGVVINGRKVAVWHNFTYVGKDPFPGITSPKSHVLLERYDFDLILTGDNHQSFVTSGLKGNILVNPGSLTRQTAAQIDAEPCVYLWYSSDNSLKRVVLPYTKNVVSREHIELKKEHDEKMLAYISKMDTDWQLSANFTENLTRYMQANRIRREVKEVIYECVNF